MAAGLGKTPRITRTVALHDPNRVAYLLLADNISGLLSIRLRRADQPVIRTRNVLSTFLPSLLADP